MRKRSGNLIEQQYSFAKYQTVCTHFINILSSISVFLLSKEHLPTEMRGLLLDQNSHILPFFRSPIRAGQFRPKCHIGPITGLMRLHSCLFRLPVPLQASSLQYMLSADAIADFSAGSFDDHCNGEFWVYLKQESFNNYK